MKIKDPLSFFLNRNIGKCGVLYAYLHWVSRPFLKFDWNFLLYNLYKEIINHFNKYIISNYRLLVSTYLNITDNLKSPDDFCNEKYHPRNPPTAEEWFNVH